MNVCHGDVIVTWSKMIMWQHNPLVFEPDAFSPYFLTTFSLYKILTKQNVSVFYVVLLR
jgi:hypothetical protein